MHILYNQSDFNEDDYIWFRNSSVDIVLANTNILTELTELEYYGKFRRAYKNEGLKDE